jgi:hypothetical protein
MSTVIITEKIPKAYVSIPFSFQLVADGGTAPYTWSVDNLANVPDGLTVSSSGLISGTATNTDFIEVPMPFRSKEVFLEIRATDSDLNQTVGRATIKLEVGRVADESSLADIIRLVQDVDNMIPVDTYLPIMQGITDADLKAKAASYIDSLAMGGAGIPAYIMNSLNA